MFPCSRALAGVVALVPALFLASCGAGSAPLESQTAGADPLASSHSQTEVQHLVVVEMQNASFDHLFGKLPASNGNTVNGLRPGIHGYVQTDASGNQVSPFLLTDIAPAALPEGHAEYLADLNAGAMNGFAATEGSTSMGYYDDSVPSISTLWDYANQYALADRFFGSSTGEAPTNQLYMIAASADDFVNPVQPAYGPCNLADSAARPMTFQNVGDQLSEKGISWGAYQESLGVCSAYSPLHDPFQYFTSTHNMTRNYSEFASDVNTGKLPAVVFVFPGSRNNMHPGNGPITNAITFLDTLVKTLQRSSFWDTTAVVVVWDTGGGWYDHAPPPAVDEQSLNERVPLLVISPLAKQHYVSHVQMDHVSILRFIQNNWGLSPLNARNTQSNDISDLFQ
jgi:phospholipase C